MYTQQHQHQHHHTHNHHLNLPKQLPSAAADDDGSGSGPESMDNSTVPYDHRHLADDDDAGVAAAAAMGSVIEEIPPDAVYAPGGAGDLGVSVGEEASQLTLSFRGQVCVFDAVTPKKV